MPSPKVEKKVSDEPETKTENEIDEGQSSDDSEAEEGSEANIPAGSAVTIYHRAEKKARKAIAKLGLKPLPNITRVTLVKSTTLFIISNPTVYASGESTFIIFGDYKQEDPGQNKLLQQQREQHTEGGDHQHSHTPGQNDDNQHDKTGGDDDDDDEEVDEQGIDSRDLDLIIAQTSVSRKKAVKAFKEHKFDMVNTIMDLSA